MNIITQQIIFSDEELTLTNQRALFWEKHQALIVSDLHLGKAAHFRKSGIALPTQVTLQDLDRLAQLIQHFAAKLVIIVGDLIHAGANTEVELLQGFIAKKANTRFMLIKGNHDRFSKAQWQKIGIWDVDQHWDVDHIYFIHHAPTILSKPTISGHLHPGISIRMQTKKTITLPCYVVGPQQLILPAFSLFTGFRTHTLPTETIRYAFYKDDIFSIKNLS